MNYHNEILNLSPSSRTCNLIALEREKALGKFRLRFIQVMINSHEILDKDDAFNLIKESERI